MQFSSLIVGGANDPKDSCYDLVAAVTARRCTAVELKLPTRAVTFVFFFPFAWPYFRNEESYISQNFEQAVLSNLKNQPARASQAFQQPSKMIVCTLLLYENRKYTSIVTTNACNW